MSESSGRPTVRIPEHEGKPPNVFQKVRQRSAANEAKQQEPVRPTVEVSAKPTWRESLPDWLRDSEPAKSEQLLHLKWILYSRLVFALKDVKKNSETVWIPNFENYHKGAADNFKFVRETRQATSAVIVVPEASGGVSKTTVSTLLGAERSLSTDMNVIVYDGDTSDPNVFMWYGLNPDEGWLTGQSLVSYLNEGWVPSYNDMTRYCAAEFDSGVLAIHAVRGTSIDAESTTLIVDKVRPTCHTLICDTEPGTKEDVATHALIKSADIVIVPGFASGTKELEGVNSTLDYAPYGLRGLRGAVAEHVIIAISGVKPREFNLRTRHRLARRYGASVHQVILIPFSQYIKGTGNFDEINKIKMSALDPRTRYGVSNLNRAVSELAGTLNQRKETQRVALANLRRDEVSRSQLQHDNHQAVSTH